MSVYKVERKVDTVIVEMDITLAEKVLAVMGQTIDQTHTNSLGGRYPIQDLYNRLIDEADVRYLAESPVRAEVLVSLNAIVLVDNT